MNVFNRAQRAAQLHGVDIPVSYAKTGVLLAVLGTATILIHREGKKSKAAKK